MVYPTHGAGSLCSTGIASTSWSTIGFERRHDPLLAPMEVEAFARALLAGQPTIPRYFARMRPINQAGPRLLGGVVPAIEPLSGAGLDAALGRGAVVVDARSPEAHARRHVPGSLSIPAGPSFGTWLGWVVDADRADRPHRRRPGRSRRPVTPGDPDRLRGDRRATSTAGSRRWRRSGRPVEVGAAIDVDDLARGAVGGRCRGAASSSTSASRPSSRRATCPAPSTSGRASCPIGPRSACRTTARSPRSAPAATARASRRRCCALGGFEPGRGRRAAASPDWEAHGYPLDYGAGTDGLDWPRPLRRRARPSTATPHLRAGRVSRRGPRRRPSAATPSRTASRTTTIADRRPRQHVADPAVAVVAHQPPVVGEQDHEHEHDRQQQALQVLRGDDHAAAGRDPGSARRAPRRPARTCRSRRTSGRPRTACRPRIPSRTPRRSRTRSTAA